MDDKKLEKLSKLIDLADQEYATPQEVADLVVTVIEVVQKLQQNLSDKIKDNEAEALGNLKDLGYELKTVENRLEQLITDSKKSALSDIKDLASRTSSEIDRLEDLMESHHKDLAKFDMLPLEKRTTKTEIDLAIVSGEVKETQNNLASLKARVDAIKEVDEQRLNDIERMARANAGALPVTTTHFYKNGEHVGRAKNINITGDDPQVSIAGDLATIEIGGGGHTIQDEGVDLTQRTNLNFVGAGVAATDDAGNDATIITINGGDSISRIDISDQFDGVETTFTIPTYASILSFNITGWPPNGELSDDDFTTPTSTTVALTAQVSAPEAGATGIIIYKTSSGSGGGSGTTLTKQAVTGTVDDSNTTFTVANEPLYIVVNGYQYAEGEGLYTSYSAGTITLSSPVGTGGFITSYYNA